jgi:4-amino-4-deoxy-L-arabinose transferase-like glycosyltransferase
LQDEFAYTWNALYWSGRTSNSSHIAWVERPPLLWWGLTFILSLGVSPIALLAISPMFAVLLSLLITQFAKEITGDRRTALVAGLITALSSFVALVSAHVLTDSMGTFYSTLSVYAFYKYFVANRESNGVRVNGFYCVVWGSALALAILARDESLILIPLFVVMWIFFVLKSSTKRKFEYLAILALLFGGPVVLLKLAGDLQLLSDILTPIVLNGWWIILFIAALFSYIAHKAKSFFKRDLGLAFLSFFTLTLPFFFDNYLIGNVEFYVAGKGVLSRPISHVLMGPQTGGVGSHLPEAVKASIWLSSVPELISPLVLALAAVGFYLAYKTDRRVFLFLLLWMGATLGFVVFGTNLQDRFLLIAFPPICVCAAVGLLFLWKMNAWVGVLTSIVTLALVGISPRAPLSLNNEVLVQGLTSSSANWLFGFVSSTTLGSPTLRLAIPNLVDGVVGIVTGVAVTMVMIHLGSSGPPPPVILNASPLPIATRASTAPREYVDDESYDEYAAGSDEEGGEQQQQELALDEDRLSADLQDTDATESKKTGLRNDDDDDEPMSVSNVAEERRENTLEIQGDTMERSSYSSYFTPEVVNNEKEEDGDEWTGILFLPDSKEEDDSSKRQQQPQVLVPDSKYFHTADSRAKAPALCPKCGTVLHDDYCMRCESGQRQ